MIRERVVSVLLAVLLVTASIGPVAGASAGAGDELLGPSITEDVGLFGWSPSDDVVRYGGDRVPGWFVWYENGSATDLQAWADGSNSREILANDTDGNVMLIKAPARDVGIGLSIPWGQQRLRDLSYVERIGVNRKVAINPITPTEVATESSWSAPRGASIATLGGYSGEFSADGAAWGDEVNTSSLLEARQAVGADQVNVNGSGVRVAVLDTGLDWSESLYEDRVVAGRNSITNTTLNITDPANATVEDYEPVADGSSSNHGSWVATAIAGNGTGPNATGIAPGALLIPVKVLGDDGSGTTEDIADGLEYACGEANADVVSMSLGTPVPAERLEGEIQECLEEDGVSAVVVAAGNSRTTFRYVASPADVDQTGVVTVAATDSRALNTSESAYFSNVGPDPETGKNPTVGAPGMKITATVEEGNRTLSGTSMATPIVSGTIALTLEANGQLKGNPDELQTYLEDRAEPMTQAGVTEVGSGRISAANAVQDVEPSEDQPDARTSSAEARDAGNEALAGSLIRELFEE